MKINNNKGFLHICAGVGTLAGHTFAYTIFTGLLVTAPLTIPCVWHIPAWDKAKQNHTESEYQAQQMFPQQLFSKLGNGNPVVVTEPTGGYWEERLNPDVKSK